ncbi:MAG: hypothetical protein WEB33_13625 [Bacteroidota bacterium]
MKADFMLLCLVTTSFFLAGFTGGPQPPQTPKDVNLSIKKVGNVWRVVLAETTSSNVRVVKGQKIIFHAEGSDVYLQFDNDQLFGGNTRTIKNGNKLTLGVGNVAKGVYTYAAFCTTPMVFAEGDSPPKIIVD